MDLADSLRACRIDDRGGEQWMREPSGAARQVEDTGLDRRTELDRADRAQPRVPRPRARGRPRRQGGHRAPPAAARRAVPGRATGESAGTGRMPDGESPAPSRIARASSSAKNGFPPERSSSLRSTGLVGLTVEPQAKDRRQRAERERADSNLPALRDAPCRVRARSQPNPHVPRAGTEPARASACGPRTRAGRASSRRASGRRPRPRRAGRPRQAPGERRGTTRQAPAAAAARRRLRSRARRRAPVASAPEALGARSPRRRRAGRRAPRARTGPRHAHRAPGTPGSRESRRLGQRRLPERGLADPRLTDDHDRAGPRLGVGERVSEYREIAIAPDHLFCPRIHPLPYRPRRRAKSRTCRRTRCGLDFGLAQPAMSIGPRRLRWPHDQRHR